MSTRSNPRRGDRKDYSVRLDIGDESESDNDQASERNGDSEADGENFQENEGAESTPESEGVDDEGNLDEEGSYARKDDRQVSEKADEESIPSVQGTDSIQGDLANGV